MRWPQLILLLAACSTAPSSPDLALDLAAPGDLATLPTGAACNFNSDCAPSDRCHCDTDCLCQPGVRGSGVAGVDVCQSGDDCRSSLCIEGNGGIFYCSGPCPCSGQLPRCVNVSPLGPICVR